MPKYKVGDKLLKDGKSLGEIIGVEPETRAIWALYRINNGIEEYSIKQDCVDDDAAYELDTSVKVQLSVAKPKQSVSHPAHYNTFSIEVIEMMRRIYGEDKVKIFCELNAFKYKMRAGEKGDSAEDLEKAKWYLNYKKELEDADLPF